MKTNNKKYKLEYQDVFLYSKVLSIVRGDDFGAEMSTPFKYKDLSPLGVYMANDTVSGIGQRNFQRERLEANRGKLLVFLKGDNSKIVGYWSSVKQLFTLYPTEKLEPSEIKVLSIIKEYLTKNDVSVKIEIDEKRRYRREVRLRHGDVIQRRSIPVPHYTGNQESEDW